MSDGADRREARRFTMTLPLRVLRGQHHSSELKAQTRDVSYRGLYFLSESSFDVGNEVEFIITLPRQMSQAGEVDIRCQGQIVRVEPSDNGRIGIAARIDRYEFTTAEPAA